jgi:hypothetical protein
MLFSSFPLLLKLPVEFDLASASAESVLAHYLLGLRTADGVNLDDLSNRFGPATRFRLEQQARALPHLLAISASGQLALTQPAGFMLANNIMAQLLQA